MRPRTTVLSKPELAPERYRLASLIALPSRHGYVRACFRLCGMDPEPRSREALRASPGRHKRTGLSIQVAGVVVDAELIRA